jgi:hypothetical protein
MKTKEAFHKLIDKIDNEEILKGYLMIKMKTNEK